MYEGLRNLEVPGDRKRGRGRRFLKRGFVIVLIVVLIGIVFEGAVFLKANSNFRQAQVDLSAELKKSLPNQALNILVLGSDNRSVIGGDARDERQFKGGSGQRADTIILIHVAPHAESAVVVSIPRDLWVEIPGHGHSKINAAYAYGGPALAIRTVKLLTGLEINHYVEINFQGFRSIVSDVGGVDIYVNRPLIDRRSGLNIPKAGCIHMDGDVALSFVRARYIDPTADLGRIQRQQLFMRTVMHKAKSIGVLLNASRILALSNDIGKNLVLDKGMGLTEVRAIANELSGQDQQVDFRIVPARGSTISGQSVLLPNVSHAGALFAALKDGTSLPPYGKTSQSVPVPKDVYVKIFNGSGVNGLGGQVREKLAKAGFHVVFVRTAPRNVDQTQVTYSYGENLKGTLMKKYFPDAAVYAGPSGQTTDIVLTLGPDAAPSTASPTPGTKPSTNPTSKKRTGASCG